MIEEYITREELEELRELINIANDALITWKQRAIEAEALAAKRKELLRRCKSWLGVAKLHLKGMDDLLGKIEELENVIDAEI